MNKLKFETNSFGIKRCIINTSGRWVDYSVYESFDNLPDTNSTKVLRVDTTEDDPEWLDNFVPESFVIDLDFETKEYFRMVNLFLRKLFVFFLISFVEKSPSLHHNLPLGYCVREYKIHHS